MEVAHICLEQGFPGFPKSYIDRPHIVDVARNLLATSQNCLLIEGDEGIGISAFLAETASTSRDPILYLYVRNGSRITYSVPYLLTTLIAQVSSLLGDAAPEGTTTIAEWRKALLRLQQKARRTGQQLIFIVDGLYQLPHTEQRYVKEILSELLCFGLPEVRATLKKSTNPPSRALMEV